MKTYQEAVMILKELDSDSEINCGVGYGLYGAVIYYSFRMLDVHFFDVISLTHMKNTYPYQLVADMFNNYYKFTLPDDSILNISNNLMVAWVQIPIKNT